MELPSQLEQFLSEQRAKGEHQSEGVFTQAREKALSKIAEYSLPFSGAWAVKLVQSAVAGGDGDAIRVSLSTTESRFEFDCNRFSVNELESGFYDPHPKSNTALDHLLRALWAIGLGEGWPFQISLPNELESLIWDGSKLNKVQFSDSLSSVKLLISHKTRGKNWIDEMTSSAKKNAEVLKALTNRCFTCPIPLMVDGRRLDSLFRCPNHGLTEKAVPVAFHVLGDFEPKLPLPSVAFQNDKIVETLKEQGDSVVNRLLGAQISARSLATLFEERVVAGLPVLLSSHKSQAPSFLYWVRDGVIVDSEPLFQERTRCSVGVFVNAEGLESDLTFFQLRESGEREARVLEVRNRVAAELVNKSEFEEHLEDAWSAAATSAKRVGAAFVLLSVPASIFQPGSVIFGLVAGAYLAVGGSWASKNQTAQLRASYEELRGVLSEYC